MCDVCVCHSACLGAEENFKESILLLHIGMNFRDSTGLPGQCFYGLSRPADPHSTLDSNVSIPFKSE